nr:PREDICTED: G-protein coupled receptor 4-like [Lepisosteus oculatus]
MSNRNNSSFCDNIDFSSDTLFLSLLYSCVFCVGLPLNCLALFGLHGLLKAGDILPVFVINLLLSDLLQILTLPLWIDYFSNDHKWRFGEAACRVIGCIFWISLFVSIFFMCCIFLERYMAVTHPLLFQKHIRVRNSCIFCAFLWVFVTICSSVGIGLGFESAPLDRCMETYPTEKDFAQFQLIAMTITFVLPLCFLLSIYRGIQKNIVNVTSIRDKEKRKILLMLTLIIVMFVLVFGPFHFMCYVAYIGILTLQDSCDYESRIFIYFQVAMGLLSLNSVLDPVMYIFVRKDLRKKLITIFSFSQKKEAQNATAGATSISLRPGGTQHQVASSHV